MNHTTQAGAAAVAAASFVISGATVVGHKIPDQHWGTRGAVLDVAFAIGMIAAALALPAVASRIGVRRLGTTGSHLAQVGQAAMAIESIASTIHGGNTLGPVFSLGLLGALVGLVLVGIDGLRVAAARSLAPVPAVALVIGIAAGNQGGAIILGLAWAALALALTRHSAGQPAPAHA